jgi:hypothetical protein
VRWRFRGGILRVQMEREREGEESVCRLEFGEEEEEEQCLPLLGPSEVWSQVGISDSSARNLKSLGTTCIHVPHFRNQGYVTIP